MITVAKFGGSSVANANQFKKVKNIVRKDENRSIVIVSAMGKRTPEDDKITDLFIQLYHHPSQDLLFNRIYSRFVQLKTELNLDYPIESELRKLKQKLAHSLSYDDLISRGEYFTAQLMAEYLGYEFLDAKEIIQFTEEGMIDFQQTEYNMNRVWQKNKKFVIPGFYGNSVQGNVKLMERGGSDVSGALIAWCVNADLYENWTDVSGFYLADPRVIENPKKIQHITYKELKELSHRGANVLHEEAIYPAKAKHIPIQILNTNRPLDCGTLIVENNMNKGISGIAVDDHYSIIHVYNQEYKNEIDTIHDSLEILKKYKIKIENIPTGIDDFSFIVKNHEDETIMKKAIAEIYRSGSVKKIQLVRNISLISIVGDPISCYCKMMGKIFTSLGNKNIDIKMISKGNEDMNLLIGVDSSFVQEAMQSLYDSLV